MFAIATATNALEVSGKDVHESVLSASCACHAEERGGRQSMQLIVDNLTLIKIYVEDL